MNRLVVVYLVGFVVTWIAGAIAWSVEFRDNRTLDVIIAGIWGLLVALVWPLVVPAFTVGHIGRFIARRFRP